MQSKKVYIDKEINVLTGEDAARLIERKISKLSPSSKGILKVSKSRWQEAQYYEHKTWMDKNNRNAFSSENNVYKRYFNNYQALQNAPFQKAIELGCGPFTNIRLILEQCTVRQIELLDPLIKDYLDHPLCQYRHHRLGGVFNVRQKNLLGYIFNPLALLTELKARYHVGGWQGKKVKIVPSMIESFHPKGRYDLVVMINVIEHCQDANLVLDKMASLLESGGTLVFHERLFDKEALRTLTTQLYDAGHPILITPELIEQFLKKNFIPVFQAENIVKRTFRGISWEEREFSYIGKKR